MSNRIQLRRGTEAERMLVTFAQGEPMWCTDSLQMYIGDGVTKGGKAVRATDMSYVRNSLSNRFNEQINVSSVVAALDNIFKFTTTVQNNIYYGDIAAKSALSNIPLFFSNLTVLAGAAVAGAKSVSYISTDTYRVFAYPKSLGTLAGIQDPNFNFADITATYEIPPRELLYEGTLFYVYLTVDTMLNDVAKSVRYIL